MTSFTFASGTSVYCPTAEYVAGPNEAAIISVQLDCNSVPASGNLSIKPVVQVNTGTDTALGWWVLNTNDSAAAREMGAWSTYYTTLTEGASHTFKLQMYGSPTGTCFCNVLAQIFGI